MKAIVLLGYRNAGKDSVCKKLQEKFSNIHNAKFGAYNKSLAAHLLLVPSQKFEDKEWRQKPILDHLTPLDILNSLFYLSETNEKMQKNIVDFCLAPIRLASSPVFPVFTDVRRQKEMDAVFDHFGKENTGLFWLEPTSAKRSAGDEELDELFYNSEFLAFLNSSVETNADRVISFLRNQSQVRLSEEKPTLHLVNKYSASENELTKLYPTYEPLLDFFNTCQEFVENLKAQPSKAVALTVFNFLVNELEAKDISLSKLTEESVLLYSSDQHRRFLPHLRKIANLKYHISEYSSKQQFITQDFTKEELVIDE